MSDDQEPVSSSSQGLATRTGPREADGAVGGGDPKDAGDNQKPPPAKGKPGIDDFVDNTVALLRRSTEVLPFVWIAIVILVMTPVLWKITQGYDPMQPLSFDISIALLAVELSCQAAAVALFTLSLPVGRAYLFAPEGGPQTFGEALSVMGDHLDDAILIAVIYYIAVMVGLMMCILPGLLAATFLAPALYLASARGESSLRAILKSLSQFGNYSHLYVIIVVGLFAVFLITSLFLGTAIQRAGGTDEIAAMAAEPMAILGFSVGFLVITTVLYLLYIAAIGLFATVEAHETGIDVQQED